MKIEKHCREQVRNINGIEVLSSSILEIKMCQNSLVKKVIRMKLFQTDKFHCKRSSVALPQCNALTAAEGKKKDIEHCKMTTRFKGRLAASHSRVGSRKL